MTNLQKPIKILKQGGIVIFPTDTAFGIGCRIDKANSVKRLFEIRQRPFSQAAPVLVNSIAMAQKYLSSISNNVRHLMNKYWPGALTIVYPCKIEKVPSPVRGGDANLGVRIPNHDLTLALIKAVNIPILGPSANFHRRPTPYQFKDIDSELVKLVDYIVEGKCQLDNVSTVIDCSIAPWKIIRQGAVVVEEVVLYIDTSNNKKVHVSLTIDREKKEIVKETDTWTSQMLLPLLDELLLKNRITLNEITEIKVNTGPGSFTGLRVGAAVANTLGWFLGIPVNGKRGKFAEPVYE